jgi:hypothetical protein
MPKLCQRYGGMVEGVFEAVNKNEDLVVTSLRHPVFDFLV